MSYVTVVPEAVTASASDLANLGSTIRAAAAEAGAPTTSVVAAAQDEVSTAIAALFGSYGQQFQALNAKAAAFHDQFVAALTGGAASYVEAEAANVLGLIRGEQAGVVAAAAAAPAAEGGFWTIFEKIAEFIGRTIGAQVDRQVWLRNSANNLAYIATQTRQILDSGLLLAVKDGVAVFTDGKNFLISGGKFDGLLSPELFIDRFENPRWLNEAPWRKAFPINLDPQYLRSLVGTELRVFDRGEGLAQTYLHKVGNEVYQVEQNVEGQIINQVKVTSKNLFDDAALLRSALGDARRAVEQAEQEFLRQAEQATRQFAEQALQEAQKVIHEARIPF